jgi:hypothetical protein
MILRRAIFYKDEFWKQNLDAMKCAATRQSVYSAEPETAVQCINKEALDIARDNRRLRKYVALGRYRDFGTFLKPKVVQQYPLWP